jgi:divalent metal cation (Fe/Co/Zn/Cd) transporter
MNAKLRAVPSATHAAQRDAGYALRRLASGAVLAMALALSAAKIWGWCTTGSVALLTSAADAVVDLFAASATFAGVRFAAQAASPDQVWLWQGRSACGLY